MDTEKLARELYTQGYSVWSRYDGKDWHVTLECGVAVLPATVPWPHGSGSTQLAAIQAAVICRNELTKGKL